MSTQRPLQVCDTCDTPGQHGMVQCAINLKAARERWRANANEAYDERDRYRRERDEFRMALRGVTRADSESRPAHRAAIDLLARVAGAEEEAKCDV